jgi:acyl carrier protein
MAEREERLASCFLAVFPELSRDEIYQASSATVQSWDSAAGVTLLAVIEEEFGINIDVADPANLDSFERFLICLQQAESSQGAATGE